METIQKDSTPSTKKNLNQVHRSIFTQLTFIDTTSSFDTTFYYVSDTIRHNGYEFILYGHFNKSSLKHSGFTEFDTIHIFRPTPAKILAEDYLGGYGKLSNHTYNLKNIIQIKDVNQDGRLDFTVYNHLVSGGSGQNSCYAVFLNKDSIQYSHDYSKPNLQYNSKTKEFVSRSSGGGGNYGYSFFKAQDDKLELLRIKEVFGLGYDMDQHIVITESGDTISNILLINQDTLQYAFDFSIDALWYDEASKEYESRTRGNDESIVYRYFKTKKKQLELIRSVSAP